MRVFWCCERFILLDLTLEMVNTLPQESRLLARDSVQAPATHLRAWQISNIPASETNPLRHQTHYTMHAVREDLNL